MENKLRNIIDYLKSKKIRYADARFLDTQNESIETKNGRVEAVSRSDDRGVGVRVLHKGAWGFASTPELSEEALKETADRAVEVARTSALANKTA